MPSKPSDKHIQNPARLKELYATALLDSPAEEAFDRLAYLAFVYTKAPVALITLVDSHRQFFKSCIGLAEPWKSKRESPLSHSFCQYNLEEEKPLVISDARSHPDFKNNLAIKDLGVVAYLGIPLKTSKNYILGSLCVLDSKPRQWREEEISFLQDLAKGVMAEIDIRAENTKYENKEYTYKEAEERYSVLFKYSADAIAVVKEDGHFLDMNHAYLSLFEYSRQELNNLTAADIWVDPEERMQWAKKMQKSKFVTNYTCHQKTKSGKVLDIMFSSSQCIENGDVIYLSIIRDCTNIKLRHLDKEKIIHDLTKKLSEISTLRGIIHICSYCYSVRNNQGLWENIESYIKKHSLADLSHGICPQCFEQQFPEFVDI